MDQLSLPQPDPTDEAELAACTPVPLSPKGVNPRAAIPYGCKTEHVVAAMQEYLDFLGFINGQLATRQIPRFETMLMPANFSSMVGEFMSASIPKYCPTICKNAYHNGHPDLIPRGQFPNDSVQHAGPVGIEIKASRYKRGWQGHNREDVWLMVFVFDSNRPVDASRGVGPRPFRFVRVLGARIDATDWKFEGRAQGSRRTITATVLPSGYDKMAANWIYWDPALR